MTELITDEMLAKFTAKVPPHELVNTATKMYGEVGDRIVIRFEFVNAYLSN